jgi:hypothetical protein
MEHFFTTLAQETTPFLFILTGVTEHLVGAVPWLAAPAVTHVLMVAYVVASAQSAEVMAATNVLKTDAATSSVATTRMTQ